MHKSEMRIQDCSQSMFSALAGVYFKVIFSTKYSIQCNQYNVYQTIRIENIM